MYNYSNNNEIVECIISIRKNIEEKKILLLKTDKEVQKFNTDIELFQQYVNLLNVKLTKLNSTICILELKKKSIISINNQSSINLFVNRAWFIMNCVIITLTIIFNLKLTFNNKIILTSSVWEKTEQFNSDNIDNQIKELKGLKNELYKQLNDIVVKKSEQERKLESISIIKQQYIELINNDERQLNDIISNKYLEDVVKKNARKTLEKNSK